MSYTTTNFTDDQLRVDDLTESELHGLLASKRRRSVLSVLTEQTTSVERADLAAEIAAREEDCDATDEETVKNIEVTLHHTHLPKMDDLGVINYNADSQQITRSESRSRDSLENQ